MHSTTRRDVLKLGVLSALGSVSQIALGQETKPNETNVTTSQLKRPSPEDIDKAKEFIATLELAEPRLDRVGLRDLSIRSDANQAFVNDGSMQAFVTGMSANLRSDVLNSTLLAQLAATRKFDRFTDAENWYKFYKEVLENIGWVLQAFDFTKFTTGGSAFSVNADVIKVLLAICTGNEAALVQSALEAIRRLSDQDERVVLFEKRSHSDHQGNFQICAAAESAGTAVMKFGGFKFDTEQNVTRVLFFSFSSASASLFKGTQTVVLNDDVYSQVRAEVIKKLGDKAKQYIKDIEI